MLTIVINPVVVRYRAASAINWGQTPFPFMWPCNAGTVDVTGDVSIAVECTGLARNITELVVDVTEILVLLNLCRSPPIFDLFARQAEYVLLSAS